MILIVTALYCEAKPFIEQYHLKKSTDINKFQVFQNEQIVLVITNPGSIAAATAVSHICTLFPLEDSDFLINVGVCGTADKSILAGSVFLCNKITEQSSGRSFYPDMLLKHPFSEADSVTVAGIIREGADYNKVKDGCNAKIFDMEAAGIYQAASYYVQPHQISFVKIVSDYGEGNLPTPDKVTQLMEQNISKIAEWIQLLTKSRVENKPVFGIEEELRMQDIAKQLCCSMSMKMQLRQYFYYYKLANGSFMNMADDFCSSNPLPCQSKREGKIYFEQLKDKLI